MDLDKFREILVATQSAAQNKDAEVSYIRSFIPRHILAACDVVVALAPLLCKADGCISNTVLQLALQQVIMSDPDFACGAFVACMSVDDSDVCL